jgi:hypothetical protein
MLFDPPRPILSVHPLNHAVEHLKFSARHPMELGPLPHHSPRDVPGYSWTHPAAVLRTIGMEPEPGSPHPKELRFDLRSRRQIRLALVGALPPSDLLVAANNLSPAQIAPV